MTNTDAGATGRLACEGWSDEDPRATGVYTLGSLDGGEVVRLTHAAQGEGDGPFAFSDAERIRFDPDPRDIMNGGTGVDYQIQGLGHFRQSNGG